MSSDGTRLVTTLLARAVIEDYRLNRTGIGDENLQRASAFVRSQQFPLVYTAFDGDHLGLTDLMRRAAIARDAVPVDPEAILGYKDLVDAHGQKAGVLADDLSLLRGCDELWIFTDLPADPHSLSRLAEGALIELLFFQRVKPQGTIKFFPVVDLLARTDEPKHYSFSLDESITALHAAQHGALIYASADFERELRPVHSFVVDPLDSKYARWVRHWCYREGTVPLVAQLGLRPGDADVRDDHPLSCLLVGWAILQRLAEYATILAPMQHRCAPSAAVTILEDCLHDRAIKIHDEPTWEMLGIPKIELGPAWPLTDHERSAR